MWPLVCWVYVPEESPYDALRSTVADGRLVSPEEAEDQGGLGVGRMPPGWKTDNGSQMMAELPFLFP